MKTKFSILFLVCAFFTINTVVAQSVSMQYAVSMQPEQQIFHVVLKTKLQANTDFVMPVWTPGYYQKMNFSANVLNFKANNAAGQPLTWEKKTADIWTIETKAPQDIVVEYDVKGTRAFVGAAYLGTDRGYFVPGALFLYPDGKINTTSSVQIQPVNNWETATGLENIPGKENTYYAPDFDILYDSPFLIGPLETLPEFTVKNIPHKFTGYKLGEFDRQAFIKDLQKIVTAASNIIGDVPYKKYTFLAIGPGGGGIEHLNSASISFNGNGLNTPAGKNTLYNFIAHEYFHNFNVKRIRPIELGPFDYKNGSRTNMLWVSEGLSVYYEYMVVRRAGLSTEDELFNSFRGSILNYETKPGRHYQSLVQSSYNTWSDGSSAGRSEEGAAKTISYYDKGPAVGLLMDFAIRHATKNTKSLDDVMRKMYTEYYQKKKRGFTEAEFRAETEKIAGIDMSELFDYTTTTKELNYEKYANYGGLTIDTVTKLSPTRYTGLRTRMRGDSLTVNAADYDSPAWKAGIRSRSIILKIDGQSPSAQTITDLEKNKQEGDKVTFTVLQGKEIKTLTLALAKKTDRSFIIKRKENPDPLQKAILESWLK